MGVYIAGMQIPDNCSECVLAYNTYIDKEFYLYCKVVHDFAERAKERCPIISVSDHGKLIDADKLIARLERQRTVILHNLPEVHAIEEGYTKEDYIFERNGDMVSILRNQAGVIPSDMEDSKE